MDEIETRARQLAAIKKQIAELRMEQADIENELAGLMEREKSRVINGVGSFERKWTPGTRTWFSDELLSAISRQLPTIPRQVRIDTGEVEGDAELMRRVLADCARFEWRQKPLEKLGIDPDEYSSKGEGRYSVKVVLNG